MLGGPKSVKKTKRLADSKFPRSKDEGDVVMTDLKEDLVPLGFTSRVVDFPLLSITRLHGMLHDLQDSMLLLHSRIQGWKLGLQGWMFSRSRSLLL